MFKCLLLFFQVKEQLAGQMIDILNPGKVSKWKVRKLTTGAINMLRFKIFFQGDLVPERLKNLEKKREKEAAERKEQERQVLFSKLLGAKCFIKVLFYQSPDSYFSSGEGKVGAVKTAGGSCCSGGETLLID